MQIEHGFVEFHDNAFAHMQMIRTINFAGEKVRFPASVFDVAVASIGGITFTTWPSDMNLNDVFGNETYRQLIMLRIHNAKFRFLSADNFSTIRWLSYLELNRCGIELIEQHTFDVVGHSLTDIILFENRLKTVNFKMFRPLFESKLSTDLEIIQYRERLVCTCHMIEMHIVVAYPSAAYIDCLMPDDLDETTCATGRNVNFSRICASFIRKRSMQIVDIRMVSKDDMTIFIRTSLASHYRVLLVNSNAMSGSKCTERAFESNVKCLILNKFVDFLHLKDFETIGDADFVSITAIPLLYNSGARPLHMITIERRSMIVHRYWIVVLAISIAAGLVIGVTGGISFVFINNMRTVKQHTAEGETTSTTNSHYYDQIQANAIETDANAAPGDNEYDYYDNYYYQNQGSSRAIPNIYVLDE